VGERGFTNQHNIASIAMFLFLFYSFFSSPKGHVKFLVEACKAFDWILYISWAYWTQPKESTHKPPFLDSLKKKLLV